MSAEMNDFVDAEVAALSTAMLLADQDLVMIRQYFGLKYQQQCGEQPVTYIDTPLSIVVDERAPEVIPTADNLHKQKRQSGTTAQRVAEEFNVYAAKTGLLNLIDGPSGERLCYGAPDPDQFETTAKSKSALEVIRAVCKNCLSLQLCRTENVDNNDPYMYGGLTNAERRKLKLRIERSE